MKTETAKQAGAGQLFLLPNGLKVAYQSKAEVPHLYEDIFDKQVYLRNGLRLERGGCVFDVGANIGLFTLFVHLFYPEVEIYAFEPAPPLFEILERNVSMHSARASLFNCGLSDIEKEATLTFYPNSSGMSSFYADLDEEKQSLRSIMQNQLRKGMEGMKGLIKHADDLLDERLKSSMFNCRLRTVSSIIAEKGIRQIDLLKIDVQKSELDVLRGINPEDWDLVRQVAIEVHDTEGRLRRIVSMLEGAGFRVVAEQDDLYEGSIMYNVYAAREDQNAPLEHGTAADYQAIQHRAKKQGESFYKTRRILSHRREE